nr:MAG TPA: hypothetical protein [Caudoviricetes sp.]
MHKNHIKKLCILTKTILQKSIDNGVKQAYNKGIETKRGATPGRGIHYDQPDHAQDHD